MDFKLIHYLSKFCQLGNHFLFLSITYKKVKLTFYAYKVQMNVLVVVVTMEQEVLVLLWRDMAHLELAVIIIMTQNLEWFC